MRLKNIDLIGAVALSAMNVAWIQLPTHPLIIGIVLSLPLVFIFPGYTLTQALFRQRSPDTSEKFIIRSRMKVGQPVGTVDYIILSLGLSLAIDVLVGFILNVFPMGLQAQSWTISLGLVTTVFALIALFHRRKHLAKAARMPKFRITFHECMLFGLAILLVIAAVWSSISRPPATQADFTQFWILPTTQAHNSCTVLIGLQSYEATTVTYHIAVTINGSQVKSWSSVVLAPQEKWEQLVLIKPEVAASNFIEAQLYRIDKPGTLYRNAHVTLHSLKGSANGQLQKCTT